MRKSRLPFTLLTSVLALGVYSSACRGENESAAPVAEVQTQTPVQTTNQPTTVTGCLRAGEAMDTFVLTSSDAAQPRGDTATYQLAAAQNLDMRPLVGQRVEVNGIVRTQQEIATSVAPSPAGERATGTTGTPTVQTTTEVAIRQMDVSALKPLGEKCDR